MTEPKPTPRPKRLGRWQSTRAAFLAGLLVLVPAGVTVAVLTVLVGYVDAMQPSRLLGREFPGLGLLITFSLVMGVGFAAQNWMGRRVISFYEMVLGRVPLLSSLYAGVKQVVEAAVSRGADTVEAVVLVEWPRKGVYSLAFLTGEGFAQFRVLEGEPPAPRLSSVFLPSTPNPTTGFYMLVPSDEIVRTDLTVEDAAKLLMSAGIVGSGAEPRVWIDRHGVAAAGELTSAGDRSPDEALTP